MNNPKKQPKPTKEKFSKKELKAIKEMINYMNDEQMDQCRRIFSQAQMEGGKMKPTKRELKEREKLYQAAQELDRGLSLAYFNGCKDLLKPEAVLYLLRIFALADSNLNRRRNEKERFKKKTKVATTSKSNLRWIFLATLSFVWRVFWWA